MRSRRRSVLIVLSAVGGPAACFFACSSNEVGGGPIVLDGGDADVVEDHATVDAPPDVLDAGADVRPSTIRRCTLTGEAPAVSIHEPLQIVTGDGGTLVYLNSFSTLRRYVLASMDPCTLVLDPTLSVQTRAFRAAPDGTVWSRSMGNLRRVHPAPIVTCTIENETSEDEIVDFDLGEGQGVSAVVVRGDDALRGKLAIDGSSCAIADLVPTTLPAVTGVLDGKGRYHQYEGVNQPLRIVSADAGVVATYFHPSPPSYPVAEALARCDGGMCILGSSKSTNGVFYVDDDGNPRAEHGTRVPGLRKGSLVQSPAGPVFLLGWTDPATAPAESPIVEIAPPP